MSPMKTRRCNFECLLQKVKAKSVNINLIGTTSKQHLQDIYIYNTCNVTCKYKQQYINQYYDDFINVVILISLLSYVLISNSVLMMCVIINVIFKY